MNHTGILERQGYNSKHDSHNGTQWVLKTKGANGPCQSALPARSALAGSCRIASLVLYPKARALCLKSQWIQTPNKPCKRYIWWVMVSQSHCHSCVIALNPPMLQPFRVGKWSAAKSLNPLTPWARHLQGSSRTANWNRYALESPHIPPLTSREYEWLLQATS